MNPRARTTRLLVEDLAGELLIYDRAQHRAHCLNRSAALLWHACDGSRDVRALARLLHQETGLPEDPDLVRLTLADFERQGLLEPDAPVTARVGRREVLRRAGIAGALLALVPALQSGPAAAAGSLGSCVDSVKCIPGLTECSPCHNGNKSQCASKVCRGGRCVNRSAAQCDDDAPAAAPARRPPMPAFRRR